jgi:ABC-type branched-subunit amino acid transport system permease subunit
LIVLLRSKGGAAVTTLVVIAALSPILFVAGNNYVTQSVVRVFILGLLVLSVELAWGQTGIFTLGQAVFFGFGAYASGMLATELHVTDLGLLLGAAGLVGLGAAGLIGAFLFSGRRVSELYVGLFTLALAYAAQRLANSWSAVGSANGIPGIPYPTILGMKVTSGPFMFYVAFALFGVAMLVCLFVVQSQYGLVMNAVRDDEERAEFLGYNRALVQVLVFMFAGGLAAVGGGMFAMSEGFVSPSLTGLALSTSAVLWVVLGGRGTFFGPLIALAALQFIDRQMQDALPEVWPVIVGSILLVTIVFLPRGLMSIPQVVRERRQRSGKTARVAAVAA